MNQREAEVTSHARVFVGFSFEGVGPAGGGGVATEGVRREKACFHGPSPSANKKRPNSVATTSAFVTYMTRD